MPTLSATVTMSNDIPAAAGVPPMFLRRMH